MLCNNKKNIWSHLTFSGMGGWVEPKTSFWRFAWQIGYGRCPFFIQFFTSAGYLKIIPNYCWSFSVFHITLLWRLKSRFSDVLISRFHYSDKKIKEFHTYFLIIVFNIFGFIKRFFESKRISILQNIKRRFIWKMMSYGQLLWLSVDELNSSSGLWNYSKQLDSC